MEPIYRIDALLRRILGMVHRFRDGVIPAPREDCRPDGALIDAALQYGLCGQGSSAQQQLVSWLDAVEEQLQQLAPWKLFQNERREQASPALLDTALYDLLESLRHIALLLMTYDSPAASQMLRLLCGDFTTIKDAADSVRSHSWGGLSPGSRVGRAESLTRGIPMETEKPQNAEAQPAAEEAQKKEKAPKKEEPALVKFDEFMKIDLRVAQVMEAERLEKSEKLVKLQIDLGEELGGRRQIVAGIAKHYSPDELVGRKIAVVANLKPAKLMGETSQGMLLAASDTEGGLELVNPGDRMPVGSKIS